jgi:hypothetical protein
VICTWSHKVYAEDVTSVNDWAAGRRHRLSKRRDREIFGRYVHMRVISMPCVKATVKMTLVESADTGAYCKVGKTKMATHGGNAPFAPDMEQS